MNVTDKIELSVPAACEMFDAFAALENLAGERPEHAALGGWLIAVFEFDAAGIAALIAGCVAGAAVLGVDAQRERVKQLLRYGICDFVVNDLDEAVRILKNEVRKKQPVSVCLSAEPEGCAREMAERGLQPEVLAGRLVPGAELLHERGAVRLESALVSGDDGLPVSWNLRNPAAAWAAGPVLARVDELAAAALDEQKGTTSWRRRWLQRAPRYMGRKLAAERCLRMNDPEAQRLLEAIQKDASLSGQVILSRDGAPVNG